MTNGSLTKVESIAEYFWILLQYFWPALSDNWSWKPICGLFMSGRFTVLLYTTIFFLNIELSLKYGSENCKDRSYFF